MEPFIKIQRRLLDWEWFDDPKTLSVWVYLLLKANWKPNRWRGIEIDRGQTLETISGIARCTGLSDKSVRTALEHLKTTGETAIERTPYGSLITVINYAKYQSTEDEDGGQIGESFGRRSANDRQTIGNTRRIKRKKEYKEVKKGGSDEPSQSPKIDFSSDRYSDEFRKWVEEQGDEEPF